MTKLQAYPLRGSALFKYSLLSFMILSAHAAYADEATLQNNENPPSQAMTNKSGTAAVLPTLKIEAMSELDPIKSYVDYDQANVTRNGLKKKDIPQTIDTIDVQKYKIYGSNDLSVMLQGTPGVSTSYDMRGDGITLRGFSADSGDIYRDGIRESGQVRRSTANIERIEILKGPASVLYGRSAGGGVVNMVSKYANFDSKSSVGTYVGSYDTYGATADINQVLNDNWAVRLTGEYGEADSFRSGIDSKIEMISPSFTYKNDEETLTWTTQYTYDKLGRVPDRGPSYSILPSGTSIKTGFAQNGDYVDDVLQVIRSDLSYEFAPNWIFHWAASYRQAEQNFDHFYLGGYCATATTVIRNAGTCQGHVGDISQIYYWQQTDNKTTSNTFDIKGEFNTGSIKHNLVFGSDWSYEQREPRLANTNQNGSAIYGYVDPITGERQSSRGTGPLKISQHNYNQGTSLGFFAQDLISLNEQFKIMLGMRYDSYDFSTTNKLPNVAADKRKRSINDDSFSPNVGVVWQPNEHQSLYASYSKSFAPFGGSMGVNPISSASQDMNIFNAEPQYNEQYEMGVKSDWFDERLNTQFSVYDIRKKNIRYRPDPDVPDVWAVGGEHQSKGLEFSFIGRVLDNLFVRGGYGYTDAQVKKDKEKPENVGNTLSNTSKNTGNLFVRYLPTEKLYGEVGVTYVGSYYPNINNLTKMDGFNRVDAAIGYSADPWNLTLAVSNLTNKEYWRSDSMPGTPRSFLMRLNYQF
ncbi:TonB-dependent siderophore receptor [Acinetobacter sp. ANC 4204]|uniref:TonB-dependent receptor n=1 Tax=Acinetobacter sp. ANC 4204 TaxID=1977884 RepID=UPI000A339D08|nr:TonB-dependent siderophore receptor [Acinetobacter sp. ANC 4204]OTG57117.1 TonB-dependent siderophore receptor [Acinetobacter sp. ANC 4204]